MTYNALEEILPAVIAVNASAYCEQHYTKATIKLTKKVLEVRVFGAATVDSKIVPRSAMQYPATETWHVYKRFNLLAPDGTVNLKTIERLRDMRDDMNKLAEG